MLVMRAPQTRCAALEGALRAGDPQRQRRLSRARAAGDVPRRGLAVSADQRGAHAVLASRTARPWRKATCSRTPSTRTRCSASRSEGPRGAVRRRDRARRSCAVTHQAPLPGTMTLKDLSCYRAESDEPLCRPYRGYSVCVPPPPSSGVSLLEMLSILDHTDIAARAPQRSAGLVPVRAGKPSHVRRPRPLRRRSALRAGAGRAAARSGVRAAAGAADRRARRPAPAPGDISIAARARCDRRIRRHQSLRGGRCRRRRRLHDDHGRVDLRLRPHRRGLRPEQSAHRLLVRADRGWPSWWRTPSRAASGRAPRWRRSSCSITAGISWPRSARRAARPFSSTTPRRSWRCWRGSCRCKQAIELPNLIARGDTFSGELARFSPACSRACASAASS